MTINHTVLLDPTATVRGNPFRWLALGGWLLIVAIMIGTAIMAANFRERALNDSARELENAALLLARHLDQQLGEFETVQKDLIAYMGATEAVPTETVSNETYKHRMSSKDTHEMLMVKNNGSSDVAGINIFNSDGILVNSTQAWPLPAVTAVLIRDDEAALAILHQLRDIGVRMALDDFGTGYSSPSYLQRFPFDKIKIDRCFISDIAEPDGSSCIVQAVVNIAAARHMTTTAEGVETEPQRDLLRALGCSEMQGYLFSPARPAPDIRQLFLSHLEHQAVA